MTSSSAGFEADYNVQNQTTKMKGPQSLVAQVAGSLSGGLLGADGQAAVCRTPS